MLVTTGRPVFVTIRGLYLLGDHFSPIFWIQALPTAVVPRHRRRCWQCSRSSSPRGPYRCI
jgi:hypothetical protein